MAGYRGAGQAANFPADMVREVEPALSVLLTTTTLILLGVIALSVAVSLVLLTPHLTRQVRRALHDRRRAKLIARAKDWEADAREAELTADEHRVLGLGGSAASQEEVAELYRSWATDLRQQLPETTGASGPPAVSHSPRTRGIRRPERTGR